VSVLTFTPDEDDNGAKITCRAENPEIMGSAVDDSFVLVVLCKLYY
jgi:hypothetical protein